MMMTGKVSLLGIAFALALAGAARADISISTKTTLNMNCLAGFCTPTVKKAVLNVTDLANMLMAGDVTVASNKKALNIQFDAPLSWTNSSRLTLNSYRSVIFQQPLSVTGPGAMTIVTDAGGHGGDFWFEKKGHVEFWDLQSSLVINGRPYTLVNTVQMLANAIKTNSSGLYAFAKKYNASKDGTYSYSPILSSMFGGAFEGLGNPISNVTVAYDSGGGWVGFFDVIETTVHNANIVNINIFTAGVNNQVGGLAGTINGGQVTHSTVTGSISSGGGYTGGLTGSDDGIIAYSHAAVNVTSASDAVGGLVGYVYWFQGSTPIIFSFSTGSVTGGDNCCAGGLVGYQAQGHILDSYSTGPVTGGAMANVGGLVGKKADVVSTSYSTGLVSAGSGGCEGGRWLG